MQIDNLLPRTPLTLINPNPFLPLSIRQAMQTQEVSIVGLDDMLFSLVVEQRADIRKVGRLGNGRRKGIFIVSFISRDERIEDGFGTIVEEPDYRISCVVLVSPFSSSREISFDSETMRGYSRRQNVIR